VTRLKCIAVIVACFFSARSAFAVVGAGGTCPSGANYTNPANPTGPLVTLSSLGITVCYYVSAVGSDSLYDGTSETVSGSHGPFLHSPGMANCSSKCAAVALLPGIGVIFRGGDTWHFGNSGATPYSGVVSSCADNGNNAAGLCLDDINATSSNPIYYGVDPTWYTGGSWARPIFTADNSLCNASTVGTLPDGATCTYNSSNSCMPGAGASCTGVYYVSSCPYQVGNSNNLIDIGYSEYIMFDNFELSGLCQNHTGQPGGFDTYIQYASDNAPVYLTNNYIHGGTHLQFAAPNGQPACTGSAVCINMNALYGAVTAALTGGTGETIAFNVVDFSDSDPVGENLTQQGFYNIEYNVFRYFTNGLMGTVHLIHDNLFEYYNGNGHSNLIESAERAPNNAIYNNVFRHMELSPNGDGGVILWLGPVATTTTDYIFNNLGYDVGASEYLNLGGTGLTSNQGHYVFFNNTWQTNVSQTILNCDMQATGTTADVNNHYIDDQNYIQTNGDCGNTTTTTSLCQSNTSGGTSAACPTYSGANSSPHYDQYTSSGAYSYSPTASTNSTVGKGTNKQPYCSALSAAAVSDSTLSNAASACQNPIPYRCGYINSTHSVNCQTPTATPVAVPRSGSGAWDIGAYQMPVTPPTVPTSANGAVLQ